MHGTFDELYTTFAAVTAGLDDAVARQALRRARPSASTGSDGEPLRVHDTNSPMEKGA